MRPVIAILFAFLMLTACAVTVRATCDTSDWTPQPRLSCEEAIAAARSQYTTTPGITELVVQYGPMCPPNARCGPRSEDLATVFANLEDGSQLYVTVAIGPDGSVRSKPPQQVPDLEP